MPHKDKLYLESNVVQIPANVFDVDIIVECDPATSVESLILRVTKFQVHNLYFQSG